METETLANAHNAHAEDWDMVIEPKRRWLDLHLNDLWRYRDLVLLFIRRDFVATYKQSILGPLWHIIQPLLTTITFTIIFGRIAKLPTDGLPSFLFYMAGNVLWGYFAACLSSTSGTFIANAGIFGKVYFPRLAVPVSIVISRLIAFGIQFTMFLIMLGWFWYRGTDVHPNAAILLLPLLLLIMAGFGLGLGILISSMTTRYRDLQYLVGFGVQLFMYATPVIYPLSSLPENYRFYMALNPIAPLIETFRYAFLGSGTFSAGSLLYSIAATAVILFSGLLVFNRVERTFMDTV